MIVWLVNKVKLLQQPVSVHCLTKNCFSVLPNRSRKKKNLEMYNRDTFSVDDSQNNKRELTRKMITFSQLIFITYINFRCIVNKLQKISLFLWPFIGHCSFSKLGISRLKSRTEEKISKRNVLPWDFSTCLQGYRSGRSSRIRIPNFWTPRRRPNSPDEWRISSSFRGVT